jgi:cytochrome c oxidase cbb3-type subunit III
MQIGRRVVATAMAGVTILLIHLSGQTPTNRALATFPAQQRPPGDPALVERGKTLYIISCQGCHGADLRGGDLGGPNLLRSQVVLSDQDGELILPIVQGARQATGMPAVSMTADDVKATATYIHSVVATAKGQGAPPDVGIAPTTILVGDAAAGQQYFAAKCSGCHSVTGDLQGIATRYPDAKLLQNRWVAGGGGGRGAANSDRRTVTVKVTKPTGEVLGGRLVRIDDFLVTLANPDGSLTTIRRDGDKPQVEVTDPMQAHRDLLGIYTDKNMHDVTAYLVTVK